MRKSAITAALALGMVSTVPQVADAQHRRPRTEENKTRNTIIGAGLGLLGGAILSGGDPWATVAGAAAGGAIGNVTTDDRRRPRFRGSDRDWSQDRRNDRRQDQPWRDDRRN